MNEPPVWIVYLIFGFMYAIASVAMMFAWSFVKAVSQMIREESTVSEKAE